MTNNQFKILLTKIERLEKNTLPELMTTMEVANMLKVSKRSLQEQMKEPDFPRVIKVGRQNRFRKKDIATYINNQAEH
jgi:excisionase family DNA binding protein